MARDERKLLLAIKPDGRIDPVPNSYEGIKFGLDQAVLTFLRVSETAGYFIDDNGMLDEAHLNVPASWFAGRPIYGPVVLCAGEPDEEGNTLAATAEDMQVLTSLAQQWHRVVTNAADIGQVLVLTANPDTIPPPQVVPLPDDWKPGDPWPT